MIQIDAKFCQLFAIKFLFMCLPNSPINAMGGISNTFQKSETGSAFFDESFLVQERCWTRLQIAKLHSRLVFQELLPPRNPMNMAWMYLYIGICLETASTQISNESVKTTILMVMVDIFGGYQQAYGLPLLRAISYEGNVDYRTVASFIRMHEEFKNVLNTDGLKWAHPIAITDIVTPVRVLNLTTNYGDDNNPCENIYLRDPRISASKANNQKRSLPIPMPVFDDSMHPNAVAYPFRDWRFRSLISKGGYRTLVDYYLRSHHCLKWLSRDWFENSLIAEFDITFADWIVKNVLPHLQTENKWYPAFSGVHRILMTIQSKRNSIEKPEVMMNRKYSLEQKKPIAVKAQRKMLILQKSSLGNITNHSKVWDTLMSRVNIVTYSTTALLFMFFLIPIIIVGCKNIIIFKNLYCR